MSLRRQRIADAQASRFGGGLDYISRIPPQRRLHRLATTRSVTRAISRVHEKKFRIVTNTALEMAFDGAGTGQAATQLSPIAAGTSDTTRIGDRVNLVSLKVSGLVVGAHTAPVPYRIAVVQWFGESTPTALEIFDPLGGALTALSAVSNSWNHDHSRFYKVLYHKRGVIGTVADTGPPAVSVVFSSKNINFKRMSGARAKINYRAAGITGTNNIWLFAISNQTDASDDGPVMQFVSVLNYMG